MSDFGDEVAANLGRILGLRTAPTLLWLFKTTTKLSTWSANKLKEYGVAIPKENRQLEGLDRDKDIACHTFDTLDDREQFIATCLSPQGISFERVGEASLLLEANALDNLIQRELENLERTREPQVSKEHTSKEPALETQQNKQDPEVETLEVDETLQAQNPDLGGLDLSVALDETNAISPASVRNTKAVSKRANKPKNTSLRTRGQEAQAASKAQALDKQRRREHIAEVNRNVQTR